jgi:uncharacterized protein (TIGR00730 family)
MKNIVIFGGSNKPIFHKKLNQELENLGSRLNIKKFKIWYGGGKEGIMATVPMAFSKQGGLVGTVDWNKFVEKYGNVREFENEIEETFHSRQKKLIEKGNLYLCLPGGVGTLSELFDVLVENDVQDAKKKIIIFSFEDFFRDIESFLNHKVKEQFIKKKLLENVFIFKNIEEILNFLHMVSESE